MKAVIQRVTNAKVTVDGEITGEIGLGFLVLLGVTEDDTERKHRRRTLFECCKHYRKESEDYFTYSDQDKFCNS